MHRETGLDRGLKIEYHVHPLIRIVCFLVFAGWLAFGDVPRVLCAFALLTVGYAWLNSVPVKLAGRMLSRLRWFFLSLLVIYGWFTPGRPLWPGTSGLAAMAPSIEGLLAGAERIAALAAIVLGVNLLLRSTSREQLLSAIYGLARPLAVFGGVRERLAVRMMLVIEALDGTRELVIGRLAARNRSVTGLRAAGELTSDLLIEIMQRAEADAGEVRVIADCPAPAAQWGYPLLLWLGFYLAGWLGAVS